MKNQMLMSLVAKLGILRIQQELFRLLLLFYLIYNQKSKSVSKRVAQVVSSQFCMKVPAWLEQHPTVQNLFTMFHEPTNIIIVIILFSVLHKKRNTNTEK